jgi:uncharacterized protein
MGHAANPDFLAKIEVAVTARATGDDPAHDILHFKRVVKLAEKLAAEEDADMDVVLPAAWMHDFVIVPKNDPLRNQASRMSAEQAIEFLKHIGYPAHCLSDIGHAIESHSFSANISPKTIEAKVVQDADRLDGLGAIGVARCFATSGLLRRPFYSEQDSFCDQRLPQDQNYTVDHFYQKLLKTASTLCTNSGKKEGQLRLSFLESFLGELRRELDGKNG